jgi:hypothetical protein
VANARIHSTTAEIPLQRFRPDALQPLPQALPDTRDSSEAKVHSDCRFKFDGNQYSAPHWMVGKTLTIKADNHTLWASYKNKIIATHARTWERKAVVENPIHIRELLLTRKKAIRNRQQQLLFSMGEPIKAFFDGLAQAGKSLNHATSCLLDLRSQYGTEALVTAVETAIKYNAYGVDYLKNILHQTTRPQSRYPKIILRDPRLNQLQLQEPDLLIYDAITLKKLRENHDKD